MRLVCWWLGCRPDYKAMSHDCDCIPCERCGSHDTTYNDRVGDTRHARAIERLRHWLFRRWWPMPCNDCGKRFGDHSDCIPF